MVCWSLVVLIVGAIAATAGASSVAGPSFGISQLVVFIVLALLGLSLIGNIVKRAR